MAKSEAHKLGELIGNFFEEALKRPVKDFAIRQNLYFDSKGTRQARKGKKVSWRDIDGNVHDLDYVIEKNGTDTTIGTPVAFIELAWRRYTKHSKNKVQEIYGAVNPIAAKYSHLQPFKGAILSGEFTNNSLEQLKSQGFHVLYIPFSKIAKAFKCRNIDITFDEDTEESAIAEKIANWEKLSDKDMADIRKALYDECHDEISNFISKLKAVADRRITTIRILPLHGVQRELSDIESAIGYIKSYNEEAPILPLKYIEIMVEYSNGSRIEGRFVDREQAIGFLEKL